MQLLLRRDRPRVHQPPLPRTLRREEALHREARARRELGRRLLANTSAFLDEVHADRGGARFEQLVPFEARDGLQKRHDGLAKAGEDLVDGG